MHESMGMDLHQNVSSGSLDTEGDLIEISLSPPSFLLYSDYILHVSLKINNKENGSFSFQKNSRMTAIGDLPGW